MMRTIFLFTMVPLLFACGNPAEEQEKQLKNEVMAVHDSIMLKMKDIQANMKTLDNLKEAWREDTVKAEQRAMIEEQVLRLDSAREAMMQWMRKYQKPADSLSHEATMSYLETERDRIEAVGQLMERELQRSDSLLATYDSN